MFIHPSVSQPTPFIQFRSDRYWFWKAKQPATCLDFIIRCYLDPGSSPPVLSDLALQGVSLLGLLDLDVISIHGVIVQLGAILQVAGERLGLLGVAQVDHVVREAVLGLGLLGALFVLNLSYKISKIMLKESFKCLVLEEMCDSCSHRCSSWPLEGSAESWNRSC